MEGEREGGGGEEEGQRREEERGREGEKKWRRREARRGKEVEDERSGRKRDGLGRNACGKLWIGQRGRAMLVYISQPFQNEEALMCTQGTAKVTLHLDYFVHKHFVKNAGWFAVTLHIDYCGVITPCQDKVLLT